MNFTAFDWPPGDVERQPFHLLFQTPMLQYAINRYHVQCGVTLHPVLGDLFGSTLYAVSIGSADPQPEFRLTTALLSSFVSANEVLFAYQGACLGLWRNAQGMVEIDVTLVIKSRKRALRIARAHSQQAIFNLRTGQEIVLRF